MNETFPKNSIEHPTEAEIRAALESKEAGLQKDAVGFLENMGPEKLKSKAASLLLALSLFAGASSAFAGEQGADKFNLPDLSAEQISQLAEKSAKKNKIADFDWKKISAKINALISEEKGDIKDIKTESINAFDYQAIKSSEFYNSLTSKEINTAYGAGYAPVYNSQNSSEFFSNLAMGAQGFSDMQKAVVLQQFGAVLGNTYNYDMLSYSNHVAISSDAMFQALKAEYSYGGGTSGICGNIHTFLAKMAGNMGIEAWVQSGTTVGGDHVWTGLVLENDLGKQIVFLDYGTLVPTGTLNLRDAEGIGERYHGDVTTFAGFVGNEAKIFFPVSSRAGEVIKKAMGDENSVEKLNRNLDEGEIVRAERGSIQINTLETKEVKLNSNVLGLTFFNYQDMQNNPYQSLENLEAVRGNAHFGGKNFGFDIGTTVMHMNIKDLQAGSSHIGKIAGELAVNYVDKSELTKGGYGEFLARWGATLDGVLMAPVGATKASVSSYLDGKVEGAFGGRVVYVNPEHTGTFYVDASQELRGQVNDLQNQDFVISQTARNIALGADVKVFEGKVINMEVKKSNTDWGDTRGVKGGISAGKLTGTMSYEKNTSDYERFVPSSNEVKMAINYQGGPKWEVDVIGFKKVEQYKDAPQTNTSNVEVKLKLMLW